MQDGTEEAGPEQLVSIIFHECRIPLSSIKGYASLLVTGEVGRPTPRQKETAQKIIELCDSLASLLSGYLHFSELDLKSSFEQRNWTSLTESLNRVVEAEIPEAKKKKIRIVLRTPKRVPKLWGREADFDHLFINLFDNAVKFSYPGSSIWVILANKEYFLEVQVRDKGVGIPVHAMPNLFDSFYHLDAPQTGALHGTGLGLTIAKRIVDAYDGKIWFESKIGKGTKCFVRFPILSKQEVFDRYLTSKLEETLVSKKPLSLVLIQLLNWNKFRDIGNALRTKILELLEKKASSVIRDKDRLFLFVRKGIDFIAVLAQTDRKNAEIMERRIRKSLQEGQKQLSLSNRKLKSFQLEFKSGMATCPGDGRTGPKLLHAAQKS